MLGALHHRVDVAVIDHIHRICATGGERAWRYDGQSFLVAPIDARMGIVQKIFYFHVPSWYAMYLGAGAWFLGSLAYLVRATDARDAFARAGAEVAVVFGAIGLITGPLWGAKAWGSFWTWDPRLTTALLSFLVYFAYLVLRAFAGDGEGERKFSAALLAGSWPCIIATS